MKFVQHRGRAIHTILGWTEIERAYYHCPDCGAGFCPYDQSSGLGSQQLSPVPAKACCLPAAAFLASNFLDDQVQGHLRAFIACGLVADLFARPYCKASYVAGRKSKKTGPALPAAADIDSRANRPQAN